MLWNYTIGLITISGISSGGYMANQLHIAASRLINGAAIFAAGPYMCSLGNIHTAESICMSEYGNNIIKPNVYELVEITNTYAYDNLIDSPSNLKDDNVYIFSGKLDSIISQDIVLTLQEYYSHFIPQQNIKTEYNIMSEHCLPTINYGEDCNILSSPYLGKCFFDGAKAALSVLYGNLKESKSNDSNLYSFDQTKYFNKYEYTSLDSTGYIYIPNSCQNNACSLHLSLHGCKQGLDFIGNTFALHSGFNDWAEENKIIILYPYVKSSIDNPNGCWDWWGYTGKNYATKYGKQVSFLIRLINSFK